jgi:hypothetical protein
MSYDKILCRDTQFCVSCKHTFSDMKEVLVASVRKDLKRVPDPLQPNEATVHFTWKSTH